MIHKTCQHWFPALSLWIGRHHDICHILLCCWWKFEIFRLQSGIETQLYNIFRLQCRVKIYFHQITRLTSLLPTDKCFMKGECLSARFAVRDFSVESSGENGGITVWAKDDSSENHFFSSISYKPNSVFTVHANIPKSLLWWERDAICHISSYCSN